MEEPIGAARCGPGRGGARPVCCRPFVSEAGALNEGFLGERDLIGAPRVLILPATRGLWSGVAGFIRHGFAVRKLFFDVRMYTIWAARAQQYATEQSPCVLVVGREGFSPSAADYTPRTPQAVRTVTAPNTAGDFISA